MRAHRLLVSALAVPATLALAAPAGAAPKLEPLDTTPRPSSGPVRDAVMPDSSPQAERVRQLLAQPTAGPPRAVRSQRDPRYVKRFTASDGTRIRVYSDGYALTAPEELAIAQQFVDFLASRQHGSELGRLRLIIATPERLGTSWCAPNALACYFPSAQAMVIPGENTPTGQASLPFVMTHELGHHIASNRRNDPWEAVHYGPKRWATLRGICSGVRARRYFPKEQDEPRYRANPGEAWAESYAFLHDPQLIPWQYDPTLVPNALTYHTALTDIYRPWKPRARNHRARLGKGRRVKRYRIKTTLDGRISLRLRGPRRANYNLQLYANGKRVRRTRRRGSRDRLNYTACGAQRRNFIVRVVRRSGKGRFKLRVEWPR